MAQAKTSLWFQIAHPQEIDRAEYVNLIKRVRRFVIFFLFIGLLVFLAAVWFGGANQVLGVLLSANPLIYLLAFVSVFVGLMMSFGKWVYYLRVLGLKVPFKKNLAVYLSLYSMDITPGRVGRLVAAYTLNRITDIEFMNIAPMITIDIFTDFLGMAILALIAALYFQYNVLAIVIVDAALLIPFGFVLNRWLFDLFKKYLAKNRYVKSFSPYGEQYFLAQSKLNNAKVYAVSLIFTVPAALMMALALWLTFASVGVHPSMSGTVLVFSSSQVYGMVSAVPGNIGVTDISLVAFTESVLGANKSVSVAVTIMARIATLWFGVLVGGVFLLHTLGYWSKGKNVKKRKS